MKILKNEYGLARFSVPHSVMFWVSRCVLSALREAVAFVSGENECVVCGSYSGAVPVCKNCECLFDVSEKCSTKATKTIENSGSALCGSLSESDRRCAVCGKILVSEHGVCMRCRNENILSHTDGVFPLYSYRLWNKTLLFLWKTAGNRSLSHFFAVRMCSALRVHGAKVVVPVPPRPGKIKTHGWDQIADLCPYIENSGFVVCRLLERLSKMEQKKLGREGRMGIIGASYRLRNSRAIFHELKRCGGKIPREVFLLDDVMTTGSTVECCAEILKNAGVEVVKVITLFIVD